MSSRNFIRFLHKADIYKKTSLKNDMGQMEASWNLSYQDVPCLYTPAGSSTGIRISPTSDETDYYLVYFNHNVDINYSSRIRNISTKVGGEIIDSGWYQVVQINNEISFSGKIQYIELKVKSVIE
jgi:hypothetical protein